MVVKLSPIPEPWDLQSRNLLNTYLEKIEGKFASLDTTIADLGKTAKETVIREIESITGIKYEYTLTVAKSGGDYVDPRDAMIEAGTLANAHTQVLIRCYPGRYHFGTDFLAQTNPYITVEGVSRADVIFTSDNANQTILTADACHFANFTIENTGGGVSFKAGSGDTVYLHNIELTTDYGTTATYEEEKIGSHIRIDSGRRVLLHGDDSTVTAWNIRYATGIAGFSADDDGMVFQSANNTAINEGFFFQTTDGTCLAAILNKGVVYAPSRLMVGTTVGESTLGVGDIKLAGDIVMAATKTVDGVDVSVLKTDVDGFPDSLKNLVNAEIDDALVNIGDVTVSYVQWGYLVALAGAPITTLAGHDASELDDIADAGSGSIVTTPERTNWNTAYGWGDHAGLYLPLAGGTMVGNIAMGGNNISNAGTIDGGNVTSGVDPGHTHSVYMTSLTGHDASELDDIADAGSGSIITTPERDKLTNGIGEDMTGLEVILNATNPTYQVDVDADYLQVGIWSLSSVNLTIDITVSGDNGLEASDAEGASKWYEIYVGRQADGTVIGFLNEAGTAIGTDPTGTGIYRQVGHVRNNAAGDFSIIENFADEFHERNGMSDYDFVAADLTHDGAYHVDGLDCSPFVPPGAKSVQIGLRPKSTNANTYIEIRKNATEVLQSIIVLTQPANTSKDLIGTNLPCDSDRAFDYFSNLLGVDGGTRRVRIMVQGWWR